MSARQNKKRKGRSGANNRERTVTTFTQDPNTAFLVPLASEEPPPSLASPFAASFSMPYQSYIPPQQQQFFQPVLPPGKNDLEILENLKSIIKDGQHEFYRAVPQPAALASLYMGHIPQPPPHPDQLPQEYPRFIVEPSADNDNDNDNDNDTSLNNTVEPLTPLSGADTSPSKLRVEPQSGQDSNLPSAQPEPEDTKTQGPPVDTSTETTGEYALQQPVDTASPDNAPPSGTTQDDDLPQLTGDSAWEHSLEDREAHHDDRNANVPPDQAIPYENRRQDAAPDATESDAQFPPPEDRRFYDRDRDRDREYWDRDRDRDRHDSVRDTRDRNRDRDIRDRRPEFFGRTYGRSHAPRPPPELRHYEPSYGDDYVPPPRRYDHDDKRGFRNASFDDRPKPPPFDDKRPPFDDRRQHPSHVVANDRRPPSDDRPIRRPPASDSRALPPSSEDCTRPVGDSIPLARTTAEDDRSTRATSLVVDDRPRNIPLEERLSQPVPTPSLQDRLSQPISATVPARGDIATAPSLEERLSSGPMPPRAYARSASVTRDDLRTPLPKEDLRDHDRVADFRANRDFSRERNGPSLTASTYRPEFDRDFDGPPSRYGDSIGRGPPPSHRYSPPPMFDRDRERDRGRPYYPPRSPPPFRGDNVYDPDGDRRYAADRERDAYEQRRRDWYGSSDGDKRGPPPPPPPSWRPHDRLPFTDRDRERFDREREGERDLRERDRERERDRDLGSLVPPPPPTRGHWDDRGRRVGFPPSPPPPSRLDATGGVGPGRSLSARLTDPYPTGGDDRAYPPPREFERGRYGGPPLDDHVHPPPPPTFSRVRNRSPSPPRRGLGGTEDLRPPLKRVREDSGAGYTGTGLGSGAGYSPPRRGGVGIGGGEYMPGPPPLSTATASTTTTGVASVSGGGAAVARSTGTRSPPPPPPPSSSASGAFYERDQRGRERERDREREQREREREREYVRGEYGLGYDRDERGRRSLPMLGSRMGPGPGYARGGVGDRRDDRRYAPLPPPRPS